MITLSQKQVLSLHSELIAETGGSDGIWDFGLLDSSLQNPFQKFDDVDLYPTLLGKAARLCYGIVKNHPMVDGNKRLGVHLMLIFLAINGTELVYTQEELYSVILQLAASEISFEDFQNWVIQHS